MIKFLNTVENALLGFNAFLGLSLTLDEVHALLGIIMLILQVVIILAKMGLKIYQKIKSKKYDDVIEIIEDTVEILEDTVQNAKIEGGKENESNRTN